MTLPIALIFASAGPSAASVVSVLGGVIAALIAVAGGAGTWAALRVGKNSQIIANYKATAESWETRANSLRAEKEGLEQQLEEAMDTTASLQAKVSALQNLATGHPAVERLSRDMKHSFAELAGQMARIEDVIRGVHND